MLRVPYINTVATGENINRMRMEAGFTVKDMQAVFGFATPQAIYKWIHGTAMPSIDNLVILAAVLGSVDDLTDLRNQLAKDQKEIRYYIAGRRAGIRRSACNKNHNKVL